MLTRFASFILASLLISQPAIMAAQQPATDSPSQPPSIRSTTRLVQVSVVALDGHGNPITGLTKEDFSLSDQGAPQTISVFNSEAPAATPPSRRLPANFFTNRYDLKGEDPGAVTIILFDALNTSAPDQAYVRKQILKFLQSLKPQDHVAIYALTTKLLILHDFAQDSTALVNAVNQFTPKETAAFDASNTPFIDLVDTFGDAGFARLQNNVNNANGQISDQNIENSVITTANAMQAIAEHVAVVPGRKSLVWVSGGFPLQIGNANIGMTDRDTLSFGNSPVPSTTAQSSSDQPLGGSSNPNQLPPPDRDLQVNTPDLGRATRALNSANVSIYPIDVHGVELSAGMSSDNRLPATTLASQGFNGRQDRRDTSRFLADRTGGVAFYGNNDIREGIRRAFDDGRFAYTIGFYPDHNTWDGSFREIKISVKTPGTKLRYRQGYFALPERSDPVDAVNADLRDAASSPLDSTSLGLIVAVKSVGTPPDRKLELRIALDPKQLLLQTSDNHRKGAVDMIFIQSSATGDVQAADKQHFDVSLDDKQFTYMASAGMILLRHVTLDPKSVEVRVILRDAASGSLGSVAIPVKTFFPPNAPAAAPSLAKPS